MKEPKIRRAIVAGQFYPASRQDIERQVSSFIDRDQIKQDVLGCVLPHAGYVYSGRVAAQVISRINIKDRVILLGPNHTGNGAAYSIMTDGAWETPLGNVSIDSDLARGILKDSSYLQDDDLAHLEEHSLEVELPILQYFKDDFEIVPIIFRSDDLTALKIIGKEIARVIQDSATGAGILIVASSDMTHYESQAAAETKDKKAIQAILDLNPDKLMEEVRRFNISMCGLAPVIVMLSAVNSQGAKRTELIKYQTSADVTRDKSAVVGYAGIIVS